MAAASNPFLYVLIVFLLASFASSSEFISDAVFESHGFTGRSLLQAKKGCTVTFENMNYTVITSTCKGPKYPANLCCEALKEFACPVAAEINDMTNDCASTMFSYINLYGKYPPGLFANECQGDKDGLSCPQDGSSESSKYSEKKSSGHMVSGQSSMLMLTPAFLAFLYHLF